MRIARQRLRWTQVVYSMFSILTIAKGSELPTLLPNDPEGLVGEDMHLWCSVSTQSQTVQNLKFSIAYRNSHTFHSFSANDSIALNGTTARLTISSLTDKHDKAKIYCENEQTAVFQVITVGREPATPKIYYFRYMNWETFEFRWKLDHKYNGFETKYTAWFKGSEDRDFIRCDEKKMPNCIGQNEHVCSVPTAFLHTKWDGFVFFKVNGTNKAGNVSSITMKKLLERIVQPGPAKILGVRAENNTDVVSYLRPEEDHNLDITFVAVSTENPNKKRKWTHRSNKQSKKRVQNQTLAGLEPFVEYQLTIHIKSIVSKFRSERSNRTFTSHEEVPSQAPEVCRGCFENDGRSTILHFKPLTKRQSRGIVTYTVKLESLSSAVRTGKNSTATGERSFVDISNHAAYFSRSQEAFHFNYTENEALFKLPNMSGGDTAYRLEIFASTSSGSGPSTFVEIPTKSQIPSPPTNCSVMTVGNSSEVVFRWNNPGFGQRLETYTAVWCKGSMNRMLCERPIDWKEVRGNESSVSVTLKSDYSRHMFGIAATEEDGRSSGIRWSCFFHDRNSVASPPHIYPLRIDETVIELQLGMPRYSPKEGLIYGYNLYYSKLNDKDDENAVAIYLEERATRGLARIERLERGKSYRFMAESLTLAGPSTFKTSRVLATKPFNFSSAEITGIVSVLILLCILAVFGFICCVRYPLKVRRWIKGLEPCMPEVILDESGGKDPTFPSHPDYCTVVESCPDYDRLNQKNHKESDDRASWCNPEPASSYSCVSSREDRNTTIIIPRLDADSTSANILPPLRTPCVERLIRIIDEASFPSRFDALSESESGINSKYDSSITSEQLIIIVETPQEVFDYIGRTEPVGLLLDQSETTAGGRSSPGIQQHASNPSLPATVCSSCDHAIDDAYVLDSTSPDLAQTELALPVLSSVHALEKRSDTSTAENVLPKIHDPDTRDRGAECDFQALGEGSSTAVSGSAGIRISPTSLFHRADQISLMPWSSSSSSLQLSLTEFSFASHDSPPSLKSPTQNTDYPTISNADDEGIYI